MGVFTTHGMGAGKPQHYCVWCLRDTRGRSLHLVRGAGGYIWVCNDCHEGRTR